MKDRLGSTIAIIALLGGCQSTPESSATATAAANSTQSGALAAASGAPGSGFLGDYSQLKPASDRDGVLLFVDRTADYRPYTKVMFDPVQMVVIPGPDGSDLPPPELARMSDGMLRSFKRALEPGYQIVSQPGPDVLRVRTALTGIQAVKPAAGAIDYLPIKALFNIGREAAGAGPRVPEMAAEMEVLDPSGKRVAAATATRKGDATLPQGGRITWTELQVIGDYWAKGLRQRLDELRAGGPQG